MSDDEKERCRVLAEKASALCDALDQVCQWTGTDLIGSHVRRSIDEMRDALRACHGIGREPSNV
jgi:hypothetical protein